MARKLTEGGADAVEVAGDLRVAPALSLASWEDSERLLRSRRESIVPVSESFVLISQIQRSGGTLLNSLLDGHPELHVHPYELHIGHPTKADWPALDLRADPDQWLELLSEPVLRQLFASGYRKKPRMRDIESYPTLPFTVMPTMIDHLFRLLCAEDPPETQRQVIDRYLTAFFNAWIDNQGLRGESKRWVAAFAPRAAWGDSRKRFLTDYPDGRIVTLLRDPRGWYASASTFSQRYADFDEAIELWRLGANEIAAAKRERPDETLVVSYEALIREPERLMRGIAEWLEITWSPTLQVPTFNRLPVRANSSYDLAETGIRDEPLERWRTQLEPEVVKAIEERALDLHAEVLALADLS